MSNEIDAHVPVFQFRERHATHVNASPEKVFEAIRSVRAEDILLFRTLVAIRRGWRRGPESILNPAPGAPIIEVATRTGFRYLANDPPHEVVIGCEIARDVFAAMDFVVTSDARGSHVSTETRVHAKSRTAFWRFAVYWIAIRAGSGVIRRMWLRAIKQRAEA
jgi:hypothetical protein